MKNDNEYGIGMANPFQSLRQMKKVEAEYTQSVQKENYDIRKLGLYEKKCGKLKDEVTSLPAVTCKSFQVKVEQMIIDQLSDHAFAIGESVQ